MAESKITFFFEPEVLETIRWLAAKWKISHSKVVRRVIHQAYAEHISASAKKGNEARPARQ